MKKVIKFLIVSAVFLLILCGCEKASGIPEKPLEIDGLTFSERAENVYAERFEIDRYQDGYSVIWTIDGSVFLIVPVGKSTPENIDENIVILNQPVDNIYLAATSAMGLFVELGSGNSVKFSGTKAEDWYIEYAAEAMEKGDMLYAGKYREPDYEMLLTNKCSLAIESTMIGHSPEVKDKLTELGIPVLWIIQAMNRTLSDEANG